MKTTKHTVTTRVETHTYHHAEKEHELNLPAYGASLATRWRLDHAPDERLRLTTVTGLGAHTTVDIRLYRNNSMDGGLPTNSRGQDQTTLEAKFYRALVEAVAIAGVTAHNLNQG